MGSTDVVRVSSPERPGLHPRGYEYSPRIAGEGIPVGIRLVGRGSDVRNTMSGKEIERGDGQAGGLLPSSPTIADASGCRDAVADVAAAD